VVPGESRTVELAVHPSRLAIYDPSMRFVCEPGTFTCFLGASAVDIWAEEAVELVGEVTAHRQRDVVATTATVD
jgi:hypothetical protein